MCALHRDPSQNAYDEAEPVFELLEMAWVKNALLARAPCGCRSGARQLNPRAKTARSPLHL